MTLQDTIGTFKIAKDADGIVTLTMDDPAGSANTMSQDFQTSLGQVVDALEAEYKADKNSIKGIVLASAKKTFFAGGNLGEILAATPDRAAAWTAEVDEMKRNMRRLELLPVPKVAAINGAALGGGYEMCLIMNRRIALDARGSQIGLPEVGLGLLPGAGGVVRSTRLLGIQDALLNVLLQGQRYSPAQALEKGLVDEVVATPEELIANAKAWIQANPNGGVQPWDAKGFKIPGGGPNNPGFAANLPAFPATLRKQIKGAPMPAPRNILAAAIEGAQVDLDTALKIETQYFIDVATSQVAKNMIQAFFFDMQYVNSGGARPQGYDTWKAKKVAVLGAGMMGAGIAYVCAKAGIEVVLKDVSLEAAQKGKAYSEKIVGKSVSRGKMTQEQADSFLALITPTDQAEDVAGADLVIEAVFESVELKHKVFGEIESLVAGDAVLGSNTSSLPITELAKGVQRPQDFIGLHFFSPVDKMPLLEIIAGEQTSDATLAKALDLAKQIKKTPIIVNDSPGFFTSRVIGTYLNEALAMVGEGIDPQTIEQACLQAGYPVGALALSDELTLTLMRKIREANKDNSVMGGHGHPADAVVDKMIDELDRPSRAAGKGFYDYENGQKAGISQVVREAFDTGREKVVGTEVLREMQERMLFIESIETVRCFDEGVLRSDAEANIGSIMGIGTPPWTGGVMQYIKGYTNAAGETGPAAFVARAEELAAKYGERFTPPASLIEASKQGKARLEG
ncbi:3-hydroxyacyl-CoA dehydrogenase NAD-binding domain-containing protein [Sporichthya polymorpha]|uniref:3-hydroxyacyl-CoA dehydrogenase NAD-binding domain-containing protein n=1 Tax=Sporichthya polymorpha TaxID=35751 RepID=UPI00037C6EF9|nr:3-hydroxyacyl-CoA dehydrogenase NAD-binding domain-containing protein [Sporichthya polymorpha]